MEHSLGEEASYEPGSTMQSKAAEKGPALSPEKQEASPDMTGSISEIRCVFERGTLRLNSDLGTFDVLDCGNPEITTPRGESLAVS